MPHRSVSISITVAIAVVIAMTLAPATTWAACPTGDRPADSPIDLAGVVRDPSGAVVSGAEVSLLNAQQAIRAAVRTDEQGRFQFQSVQPGTYQVLVVARGFAPQYVPVDTARPSTLIVSVVLELEPIAAEVTVTATRGDVRDPRNLAQPVTVINEEEVAIRAKAVIAQVATEAVGVQLLRTSPTMAGIYVRGLTGNKVGVFMDGVRYSTSSARGGVSTFLDLIDPGSVGRVEILRGPNSAQYGSDAIGGSVQFLSRAPSFLPDAGHRVEGTFSTFGNSADRSFGSQLSTTYTTSTVGLLVNLSGRRINPYRPGGGYDSHSAVTRFFGLRSDVLMPSYLPETGFTQYAGQVKLNWAPSPRSQVTAQYMRGQQDGGKRYDQLLGGDGNLIADLRNLMLDFGYVRYDRSGLGWFDYATATYSFNVQREERVNQGGNGDARASITHEYERTRVNGVQAFASKQLGARQSLLMGGEVYAERLKAPSFSVNPVTGISSIRRGRVPDNAAYRSGGVYVQDQFEAVPGRVSLVGNLRFGGASYTSRAADSPLVNNQRLWPDDSLRVWNTTFRGGVVVTATQALTISANVSRGFRAPHMTDLGTLGLTGSGFQVSASGVQGMGATVGTTAGSDAMSTGQAVEQVKAETSLSYEAGVKYRAGRVSTELSLFINDVYDNITYQTLILPQGAVGLQLGDQAITSQNANGAVYVPASSSAPVLVRTNFGDARIWGVEHTFDLRVTSAWSVRTMFTYLHAADKATGLPPNIEGGTPAPDFYLKLRYMPAGARFWVEPYIHAAARQSRLSSLDLGDRRTGASRSRSSIKKFFQNGATARGWVGPGPDGAFGTADDVLLATGETYSAIQNRVLGSANEGSLVTSIPGYVTFNARGGIRFGKRHEVIVDLENLGDRNYRGIAWGMDASGRSISIRFQTSF